MGYLIVIGKSTFLLGILTLFLKKWPFESYLTIRKILLNPPVLNAVCKNATVA